MQSPTDQFYRIVEDGLCIGCGMCEAVSRLAASSPANSPSAPTEGVTHPSSEGPIKMIRAQSGDLRPLVCGELGKELVQRIYATCPSTRIEGFGETDGNKAPFQDDVWGGWHRLVLAWAADAKVRHASATGGVLTTLGQFLVDSGRVNFVLHVSGASHEPTHGAATLSFSSADVYAGAGSHYGPSDVLSKFDQVLDRNEPFALIAKPCDLNAVRNLAHVDERVNLLVRYWLTPVCGGYLPDADMDVFLEQHNIERTRLTHARYRGNGCPGPTTFTTDTDHYEFDYQDFWGEDASNWPLPFRCKICPDGIGGGADIAAADTWPGGGPDKDMAAQDLGTNSLLVRTAAGVELMEAAAEAGVLTLGEEVPIAFMYDTQPHQVSKKRAVLSRMQGLAEAGVQPPKIIGLNIETAHEQLDQCAQDSERAGTLRRAREGQQREVRPQRRR